jgi:NAD(P)-dependent dehydrogenase (short-subunit alcohol dehydrogenase family)
MVDPLRLDGRVVIVTGASRGIGAAVARIAAHLGGHVVGVARSEDALRGVLADLPTESRAVVGDVADPAIADEAVRTAGELGGLWGLVNNAGIGASGYHPLTETSLSEWDEVIRVNVMGAAAFARAVGAALVASGRGGRIVNISSIAGLTGLPNIGPYNVTKAAMDAMTRTMAVELGPVGVCCNSVAPGTIATEMVDELLTANPALKERFVAKTPLGRVGVTDEAAWPIVFLLSDAAAFVTGQTLVVDGGRLAAG